MPISDPNNRNRKRSKGFLAQCVGWFAEDTFDTAKWAFLVGIIFSGGLFFAFDISVLAALGCTIGLGALVMALPTFFGD